jgi:hypothetical protein
MARLQLYISNRQRTDGYRLSGEINRPPAFHRV